MCKQILVGLFVLTVTTGWTQLKIDHQYFQQILASGNYARVFQEASQLRKDVYGKCAFLDYYIGKSLCLDGYVPKSKEWFQYILDHYPLKSDARDFIQNEMRDCRTVAYVLASTGNSPRPLPIAGVTGVSKSGPTYDCYDRSQLMSNISMVSDSILESRLFDRSHMREAVAKIKEVVGTSYQVNAHSQFILVTPVEMSIGDDQVRDATSRLDRATKFFEDFYGLRSPNKLITVYLAPDGDVLARMGEQVHGIRIPETIYGYSVLGDLSLLGIATPSQVGTLYHELFHLLVRTDAGDMPAWLDEGLASLYSTSTWRGDTLVGGDSWRMEQLDNFYLRKTGQRGIPVLDSLINYNWEEFNGGPANNLCRAAVNYALANHFLLYVQEKGKLHSLVRRFMTRPDPGSGDAAPALSDTKLIEAVMGGQIEQIQQDFWQWLTRLNPNIGMPDTDTVRLLQINGNEQILQPPFYLLLDRTSDLLAELTMTLRKKNIRSYNKRILAIKKKYHYSEEKYKNYTGITYEKLNANVVNPNQYKLDPTQNDLGLNQNDDELNLRYRDVKFEKKTDKAILIMEVQKTKLTLLFLELNRQESRRKQ
jgi:hypothetical protein